MAKIDSVSYMTPWYTARFPKISEPDTEGKFADGKFKTDGLLEDADYEKAEKDLTAIGVKFFPHVPVEDIRLPLKTFFRKDKEDGDKKKPDGRGLTLKSKRRPALFDTKKKKLPEGTKVGGGSVLRTAAYAFPWSKTNKMKVKNADGTSTMEDVTEYGVGLRLADTQVRELKVYSASGTGEAFDEVEGGFEYEGGDEDTTSSFDDATDL